MTFFRLPTPHSLLTYEQLLRVPERVGKDCARAVIADALIGRHGHMARDDGDDRRLFGEDSLNFAEGGCAADLHAAAIHAFAAWETQATSPVCFQ